MFAFEWWNAAAAYGCRFGRCFGPHESHPLFDSPHWVFDVETEQWMECNEFQLCTVFLLYFDFFFLILYSFSPSVTFLSQYVLEQECPLNLHGLFSHFCSFVVMTCSEEALNVDGVAALCSTSSPEVVVERYGRMNISAPRDCSPCKQ